MKRRTARVTKADTWDLVRQSSFVTSFFILSSGDTSHQKILIFVGSPPHKAPLQEGGCSGINTATFGTGFAEEPNGKVHEMCEVPALSCSDISNLLHCFWIKDHMQQQILQFCGCCSTGKSKRSNTRRLNRKHPSKHRLGSQCFIHARFFVSWWIRFA